MTERSEVPTDGLCNALHPHRVMRCTLRHHVAERRHYNEHHRTSWGTEHLATTERHEQ